MTSAEVYLWGTRIGVVILRDQQQYAEFEYTPEFTKSGIELSPIVMPLKEGKVYKFPNLSQESFLGLPGLLSDSLPDSFGQAIISAWLVKQGRGMGSLNAVERLCYTGSRGMGALEYVPSMEEISGVNERIYVDSLVKLASEIVENRENIASKFKTNKKDENAFAQIMQIGTSAGGARAKAIIGWNKKTGEVRSGQIPLGEDFNYYLLKFDGINKNRDKESPDGEGYTKIEYAYYLMAKAAKIEMSACELLHENGLNHFVTKRFDREGSGKKLHMQSLGAIAHYDYQIDGAYSYEHAFMVMRILGLDNLAKMQLLRRMIFNVYAMNHDDHVKNISFLMNRTGIWTLAPAYDLTYSYNPDGRWTSQHQMTINGKRKDITKEDIFACAENVGIKKLIAKEMIQEVVKAISRWKEFATLAEVEEEKIRFISKITKDRCNHVF